MGTRGQGSRNIFVKTLRPSAAVRDNRKFPFVANLSDVHVALMVREDELHPVTTSLTRTVDLATASVTAIAVAWCAGLIEDSIQGVQEVDQDVDYLRSLWDRMHAPSRTAMIRPHGGKKLCAAVPSASSDSKDSRLVSFRSQVCGLQPWLCKASLEKAHRAGRQVL